MKIRRWIAGILTICMALAAAAGMAASYTAAETLTLPEKLSRQLEKGSGLKGSFVINTEGSSETAGALALFNQAEIQVRGILTDEGWHYYLYQTDENENQWARTDLLGKDGAVYLKSDMLEGNRILMFPAAQTAVDALIRGERVNPPFASAVWNLLHMSGDDRNNVWAPLVQQLQERVESWLTPFASEPAMRQTESGETVMDLSYVIPADSLKEGILNGLDLIAQNQEVLAFAERTLTEEQQELYLNPNLRYYYAAALDSLDLPFDAMMSRTVTSLGKTLATSIELPLDESAAGWSSLSLDTGDGMQTIRLSRSDRTVTLMWREGSLQEDGQMTFWAADERSDGEASRAVRCDVTRNHDAWEDEETRSHETYDYTIDIVQDPKAAAAETEFAEIPPMHGAATLHFNSKYAKSSPTNVEIAVQWEQEGMKISAEGKLKSASPWVFSPFEITNPENMLEMKPEELLRTGAEWLSIAGEKIRPNLPAETAVPEETAAPAETGATEETAAPEETPAPEELPAPEETAAADVTAVPEEPEATALPEEQAALTETPAADTGAEAAAEQPEEGTTGEEDSMPAESEIPAGAETEEAPSADEEAEEIEEEDTSDWPEMTASPESDG